MRLGVPAMIAAAVLAGGCRGSDHTTALTAQRAAPVVHAPAAAKELAARYLRDGLLHRPTAGLTAPRTPADRRSLSTLERWLRSIPARSVDLVAVPLAARPPASAKLLVSLRVRLGRGAGSAYVDAGRRLLLLHRGGGGWRVVADASHRPGSGVAPSGLSAIPNARYVEGSGVVVVDAAGAGPVDVTRAELGAAEFPRLVARYSPPGFRRTPVIFLLRDWGQGEGVTGVPFPHELVGAEYRGLVFLDTAAWRRWGEIGGRGVVVHELTHVASAHLVRGTPLSLVEGLARCEEEDYDRRAGAPLSDALLAAAYRRGYPTVVRWGWAIRNRWELHTPASIELAYDDGAAITRAVLSRDGVAGVRRLAREFRRAGGGWFSPERLRTVFRAALPEPLSRVIARAHAQTFASGG